MSYNSVKELRVLELYSGIGGMHWALKESRVKYEIVFAVDINTTANQIYKHNFPDVNLNSFGIEKITLKKLQSLGVNAILMSPPCQPFSRVGKKGDCDDARTKSFLHILQLLREMDVKPEYILVENVKGFETSRTRQLLIDALRSCHYSYQEYLLTPLQFKVPNSRLRYYLIARLQHSPSCASQTSQIETSLPDMTTGCVNTSALHQHWPVPSTPSTAEDEVETKKRCLNVADTVTFPTPKNSLCDAACRTDSSTESESKNTTHKSFVSESTTMNASEMAAADDIKVVSVENREMEAKREDDTAESDAKLSSLLEAGRNMRFCEEENMLISEHCLPLRCYMEDYGEGEYEHLLVGDKSLRQFVVMDIVLPALKKSTCFTKRYGHYIEGAGSLVQMSCSVQDTKEASEFKSKVVELKNKHEWGEQEFAVVRRLRLRYFSPREVANLLCFPKEFEFPEGVSTIQRYRCLGNSLNVYVVAQLIRHLTASTDLT